LSPENYDTSEVNQIKGLARAIRGHPMISDSGSEMVFNFAAMGPLYSALATLPSLKRVTLRLQELETEDQLLLLNPELLTELLRAPALRFVIFVDFSFTNRLCHATANVLEEASSATDITFHASCSFPTEG
jgi:hypothetical protein